MSLSMSDDEWVNLVQFPPAAAASPVAVHVRINFVKWQALAMPSLKNLLYLASCKGGDCTQEETDSQMQLSLPCLLYLLISAMTGRRKGYLDKRRIRRCCREVTIARLNCEMMQRKCRMKLFFTL